MNGVQASLNEGADINYKVNTHIHIKHSFLNDIYARKLNACIAIYQEILHR